MIIPFLIPNFRLKKNRVLITYIKLKIYGVIKKHSPLLMTYFKEKKSAKDVS